MPTATGDSIGTRGVPPTTGKPGTESTRNTTFFLQKGAPTLITDRQHSLKLKMSMSVTSFWPGDNTT